ncbi:hypothetical protein EG352_06960 [Chryseobacterium indologenes]|uniref:DUF4142 domain-containing protein n=1 Tax=Chryseobacterium indologenes TaxID=253 RepID=A0AAD0YUR1_CHRID|nr:hypothetical protein [Chryseobacterium indologenes]AZB17522.1 hypothetical protein EG352_06960 [Chryseobacterium indologenes]
MKPVSKILLLFVLMINLFACQKDHPNAMVKQAWLNTNIVNASYSPEFFKRLQDMGEDGTIKTGSRDEVITEDAVEYVTQNLLKPVTLAIKSTEQMHPTQETEGIIECSLQILKYSKSIFEIEYLQIATMIDERRSETEINASVDELFSTHNASMYRKKNRLNELIHLYQKENDFVIK